MIIGLWHPGSGVGDQLFCYLAARFTARRLGVNFSMVGQFKGASFMTLDKGADHAIAHHIEMPSGKIIIDNDWPIYEGKTNYDPEFNFIKDNTIVDGCRCQDEKYWSGYPIDDWLIVERLEMPEDVCVIGFRGGEYATVPELFLPKEYWDEAIHTMRLKYPNMSFEVHTDDLEMARKFFPYKIVQDAATNWRSVRYAKHLIIANSAFYILPSLLNENVREVIAPRYWARRNIKEWSTVQNFYSNPKFKYI